MLIDQSYFIGEINIPGLTSEDVSGNLDYFISKYETEYLRLALGYPLWKALSDSMDPLTARFERLLYGYEFENCHGNMDYWTGLINTPDEIQEGALRKTTPIANYIYYNWSCDNITFTTTIGEVKGKAENSTSASVVQKQSRAYNEMSALTDKMLEFVKANAADYPEFNNCHTNPFGRTNIFNL